MQDEFFDVVDENDSVIGKALRSDVHRDGLRHRAVHVLVFNKKGEIFLQKRAMSKDTFPGAWDSSASGHLECGEDYDQCALRELKEELSFLPAEKPEPLLKLAACADTGQEFVWVYHCQGDGPFTLHPDEIESGGWFSIEQVNHWINSKPDDFARAFLALWPSAIETIRKKGRISPPPT